MIKAELRNRFAELLHQKTQGRNLKVNQAAAKLLNDMRESIKSHEKTK